METSYINQLLSKEKNFIGTFARDLLPEVIQKKPKALIANTDPSSKPGQHWISMIFNSDGTGEYFDSYGLPPLYLELKKTMDKNCPLGWGYNTRTLQCLSCLTCGEYCVLFVKLRLLGYSYCDFLSLFTYNKNKNDIIIKNLMRGLFDKQYVN